MSDNFFIKKSVNKMSDNFFTKKSVNKMSDNFFIQYININKNINNIIYNIDYEQTN